MQHEGCPHGRLLRGYQESRHTCRGGRQAVPWRESVWQIRQPTTAQRVPGLSLPLGKRGRSCPGLTMCVPHLPLPPPVCGADGAVFRAVQRQRLLLNACGYLTGFSGTAVSNVGSNGNYWSATPSSGSNAFNWNFNSGNMNENSNAQTNGLSVRLFREESVRRPCGASLYRQLIVDLRRAYRQARKHKAGTDSCIRCSMDLEEELDELARTILDGSYAMRPSICFLVTSPVLREVIAADFRDRIVHHYIYEYMNPWLERELIDDCYSCREGKGTGYGIDRLEHHIRSCSRNYTREAWALQLDIQGYFMHINRWRLYTMAMALMVRIGRQRNAKGRLLGELPRHRIVEQLLVKLILYNPLDNCEIRDPQGLYASLPRSKSLRFSPEGVGLPIGNLTSQMFSNLYMNGFDQWVKRVLKVRHYGRYVDDSYYIATDKAWLLGLVRPIDAYLQSRLDLHLNLAKTKLTEVKMGVSFLGVHIKPHRRYPRSSTLRRMRQRARAMTAVDERALQNEDVRHQLLAQANSMLGLLGHTRSFNQRKLLFTNYPLYTFACGTRGMRKYILKGT
ncbi:MAG: RNA-directed DNA polymerase [Bacteroidaceae bacterium]|nr:RNA-directed DNA polymerase [Bacteroidaceae bacterium]